MPFLVDHPVSVSLRFRTVVYLQKTLTYSDFSSNTLLETGKDLPAYV